MTLPRPEYPRPQFVRQEWLNLNGEWRFTFDDANLGLREGWDQSDGSAFDRRINVPFAFQTKLSGIHETDFHDVVWYQRHFHVPAAWSGRRILLHFGAVDYRAQVWLNGRFVCEHEGGHTPFSADVTNYLRTDGVQSLVVRVEDKSLDLSQPRGKQYWKLDSDSIFYTRTTGIWQTVWLEPVATAALERLKITPDLDRQQVSIDYSLAGQEAGIELESEIRFGDQVIERRRHGTEAQIFAFDADSLHIWSPETPNLYDLTVQVWSGGQVIDQVQSYFGLRKISVENGRVALNNQPYTMRLVLDQGYHPDGLLTFPSDEALRLDIELTKRMGFNGARKHQKVEDPRYLYWADRLGLLVWGEMANSYLFTEQSVRQLAHEWQSVVARDYNHPCIVAWVPLNESWGVPDIPNDRRQTDWLLTLYHLTKALDSTRLVISNDGWEHAKSDLFTIHDYTAEESVLRERYHSIDNALQWRPGDHALLSPHVTYNGEPVLVTEFGGIAYRVSDQEGWGYSSADDADTFVSRLRAVFAPMHESPLVQGFCYTQLTDVEQEINGLLTYDRKPKVSLAVIRDIVTHNEEHTAQKLIAAEENSS